MKRVVEKGQVLYKLSAQELLENDKSWQAAIEAVETEKLALQWAGAMSMFQLAHFRCEGSFPSQEKLHQFKLDYDMSPYSAKRDMATFEYWDIDIPLV